MDLEQLLGQEVTLHGTAMDAHAGGVLELDDGAVVFVADVQYWDDDVAGRRLVLSGVLAREALGPEPEVGADGVPTHGMSGQAYVVRDATWREA
jgi:hypothetical protein